MKTTSGGNKLPSFRSSSIGKQSWGPAGRGEKPSSLLVVSDQSLQITSAADTLRGTLWVQCKLDKTQWERAPLQKEATQRATSVGVWLWDHSGGLWVIWREGPTFSGPFCILWSGGS